MSIGDQGEEFPVKEEAVFGVNLVNPSLGQIRSTDVEAHGEDFDNHRSDLQGLPLCSYREGKGMLEPSFDVEVCALSCSSYPGDVVGFEVVLSQT